MQTFHNDPAIKAKYLARVRAHRLADNLIQGTAWRAGKGCAVGCTLESYDHQRYPIELGLPEWLAHLEDHIFEALPSAESQLWPEQFLETIPVGVEESRLAMVRDQFQIFWLERQKSQIDQSAWPLVVAAIDGVLVLLRLAVCGTEPTLEAWSGARSAAWSAAWNETEVKRDWLLKALKETAA